MHVMLDLETLSLRPDAALLQVALVKFEPVPNGKVYVDEALNVFVDLAHQYKRHIDSDTLIWWLGQSEMARRTIIEGHANSHPLLTVLQQIELWLDMSPFDKLWSRGADFDIAVLKHAFLTADMDHPWHYRQARCQRTHRDYHPLDLDQEMAAHDRAAKLMAGNLVKHDALSDCVVQICEFQAGERR